MAIACPKCRTDNPDDSKYCKQCATPIPQNTEHSDTQTFETPTDELTTGSTIADRYVVIEELGRGGMGRVYRVKDTKANEEIALKVIRPEFSANRKSIERFRNELNAARKIRHKNVCGMYDLGEAEGTHYITMEYVPGEDLRTQIRRVKKIDVRTSISIAKQICQGLAEAHKSGVIHRDLKPNNIMIDKKGNVRIMDFGIARSLTTKGITRPGMTIGTPEYMSPEQVEGKAVDRRSDIYSLGIILYEMVAGRVPFEGETVISVAHKHRYETPRDPRTFNERIPAGLRHLILRCLAKEEEKRFQSAEDVYNELERIEKGMPVSEKDITQKKPITQKEITVTFGLRKLWLPLSVIAAVVFSAVMLWLFFPRKVPVLGQKIENSIAVISFENQTGDDSFDYLQKAIPNLLITNLENIGIFYVPTWERLQDLIRQKGREGRLELIDTDLGFELCRLEGIQAIVLGTFTRAGDMFVTDVKVLDVETKDLLKSASSRGIGEQSIMENQIDELSLEIARGMGTAFQDIQESDIQITDVTTSSLEAYKYYLQGLEAADRLYWDEAQKVLLQAVDIDPAFASAYILLSEVYRGMRNIKARDETLKQAKLYSERASEKERILIGTCYAEFIDEDKGLRFELQKELVEKYPREKRFHFDLGEFYFYDNNAQAIEEYQKALDLDPFFIMALNQIGYAYAHFNGDYEKAVEYFERCRVLSPEDANPLDSMGDMYFYLGKLDEAVSRYEGALKLKPDFYFSKIKLGYMQALKENYAGAIQWIDQFIAEVEDPGMKAIGHIWNGFYYYWLGQYDRSKGDLDLAEKYARSVESRELITLAQLMTAWIHYDQGEYDLSGKAFAFLADSDRPFDKLLCSLGTGKIALREGRLDAARANLNEIDSLQPQLLERESSLAQFYYDQFFAEILLAGGSLAEAAEAAENAPPLGKPYAPPYIPFVEYNTPFLRDVLARIYVQQGRLERAIEEYERIIVFDPLRQERCLIHPLNYYRLGKLYDQTGDAAKAQQNYEKFLTLWKDADPGLPEVDDVKTRLK